MSKNIIVWEKWVDPFGLDENELITNNNINNNDYDDNEVDDIHIKTEHIRCNVLSTPFGIIPINENTASSKIFNFWTGHTNFPITYKVARIIEETNGVETLNVFTKYRFRISVGKAFKDSLVMRNINNNIYTYLNDKNNV